MQLLFADVITYVFLNKFAFRSFNRLAYNQEINSPLVASYLFRLLDYYTLLDNVKFINLAILQKCFSEFELHIYKPRLAVNDFTRLWRQTLASSTIFDHYCC